jgi:hypothetical protein
LGFSPHNKVLCISFDIAIVWTGRARLLVVIHDDDTIVDPRPFFVLLLVFAQALHSHLDPLIFKCSFWSVSNIFWLFFYFSILATIANEFPVLASTILD